MLTVIIRLRIFSSFWDASESENRVRGTKEGLPVSTVRLFECKLMAWKMSRNWIFNPSPADESFVKRRDIPNYARLVSISIDQLDTSLRPLSLSFSCSLHRRQADGIFLIASERKKAKKKQKSFGCCIRSTHVRYPFHKLRPSHAWHNRTLDSE